MKGVFFVLHHSTELENHTCGQVSHQPAAFNVVNNRGQHVPHARVPKPLHPYCNENHSI